MKGEEELSVICIKVVVERKGRDESAEGNGVHDKKHCAESSNSIGSMFCGLYNLFLYIFIHQTTADYTQ